MKDAETVRRQANEMITELADQMLWTATIRRAMSFGVDIALLVERDEPAQEAS